MSKKTPRKRKINSVTDEELMPPPQMMPVSKKHKSSKQALVKNVSRLSDISNTSDLNTLQTQNKCGPLSIILEKAQDNETLHNKYFKEMTNIYEKMDHATFMRYFLKGIRIWMKMDESNSYANVGLGFLAKYLSSLRCDDPDTITHPILKSTFDFLLKTISLVTNVRFRICQFVNLLLASMGSEANIDDDIFDEILRYMSERMKDSSPAVRVQAVYALQRLQIPENPDDSVVRLYSYHLSNDPSVLVRQAVLKSIGRNALTVPIILERLWDVDERVRRRTFLQMSSHPVKSYKVAQRLMLLEQGLNDHSDSVRKIVQSVLLPQWHQSYNRQYLQMISALKLDANPEEIQRFVKITKKALFILFKNDSIDNLLDQLPLSTSGEFLTCIPFEKLTVELTVFWLAIVEYVQQTDTNEDDEDQLQHVICELSTFCEYLSKYINYIRETTAEDSDSWNTQENQYKLHILIEILMKFDLGDEIGRQNLNSFVSKVLSTQILGESVVQKLVHCVENLIPDTNARLQYFIDIIRSIIEPSSSIDVSDPSITSLLDSISDPEIKVKIGQLKLRIMELREQENELSAAKDYTSLERVSEDLAASNEEFLNILNAYNLSDNSELNNTVVTSLNSKKISKESILHCLEICFFTVCSKCTIELSRNMFKLYEDFVQRHLKSQHMEIRDRALKCGIAFSMLYKPLAKPVHEELYLQFVRHHQPRLWTTAVSGICELFDKYGILHFAYDTENEKQDSLKSKRSRQLYNVSCDPDEQEENQDTSKNGTNVMYLFTHLFDTCQEATINMALATGFCRLILSGQYGNSDIISKIILKFFNPTTCTEINQILSVFFETLIQRCKQSCLEPALLPTVFTILDAPHESPLREIKPDAVIKFVVNSTIPSSHSSGSNIHNTIARCFLKHMHEHVSNKELLKLLSKELQTLDTDPSPALKDELKKLAESLLEKSINDSKIEGYIKVFIDVPSGAITNRGRSTANLENAGSDDDQSVDDNIDVNPIDDNIQTEVIDSTSQQNSIDTSNSLVPSTKMDQTKDLSDDTEQIQINNVSSDEESFVSSASKSISRTRGRNSAPSKTTKEKRNFTQRKEIPDENENCRIVTSTQEQSDDEVIPNTPTASPVVASRILRKEKSSKTPEKVKSIPQKGLVNKNRSPKSNTSTPKTSDESVQEKRKRHRLSQAHVRLERIPLDKGDNVIVHRTRNALVAEFKEKNIMTRNRQSLDQIKTPTKRAEHLKKLTPIMTKTPNTSTTTNANTRTSRGSLSKTVSPSGTPLPKRRSISNRTSPIPANLKLLSESAERTVPKINSRPTAISRIPMRTASTSSISPKKSMKTSAHNSRAGHLSKSTSKSMLPLRKSNRSTSQLSLRKK